jgi:hypothetical protein
MSATAREPSDVEQLKRYIATQRLDGQMDSLARAQLALAMSVPTELQKLFAPSETEHVMKTVARAIDEAVAAALAPREVSERRSAVQFPGMRYSAFREAAIMPIEFRPGQFVHIHGIPHDLTEAEAAKLAGVITALAVPTSKEPDHDH